jgi:hypothetical protein
MKHVVTTILLGVLAAACSSSDDAPKTAGTSTGTVVLRFGVADSARKSPSLKDPLKGSVYGAIFLAEDVSVTGPRDGAKEFGSIELHNVDLQNAQKSIESWTTPPLEPNKYIFTGFFDLDSNGNESRRPDVGDPATIPLADKKFDVEAGQQTEFVENFDIVLN